MKIGERYVILKMNDLYPDFVGKRFTVVPFNPIEHPAFLTAVEFVFLLDEKVDRWEHSYFIATNEYWSDYILEELYDSPLYRSMSEN